MPPTGPVTSGRTNQLQLTARPATSARVLRGPLPKASVSLEQTKTRVKLAYKEGVSPSNTLGYPTINLKNPLTIEHGFTVRHSFEASVSGAVNEGFTTDFNYGLVQNLMYSHIEAQYTLGQFNVDTVGPYVDVDVTEPPPYIHRNATRARQAIGGLSSFTTTFVDRPSLEVTGIGPGVAMLSNCGHLERFKWVTVFRLALVAHSPRERTHVLLGVLAHWYRIEIELRMQYGPEEKILPITFDHSITGEYPLVSGECVIGPPLAINEAEKDNRRVANVECGIPLQVE